MICKCGNNTWEHIGATRCGSIRCTVCGYVATPEDVKAYRKTKVEAQAKVKKEEEP